MTLFTHLLRWERAALGLIAFSLVAFGAVVEIRSAFQQERRTDFGVYARAGWSVRAGQDLYAVADDRGWHYCYPPAFAVLMTPFADPPAGEPRVGYLPFAVSVGVWYAFSVACVWFALTRFAGAILPEEPVGTRRWWTGRTGPFTVAIGAIGYTLARGQVNLFVVAMVAGLFAAHVRGKRFTAGLWLGAAICVKVIPAFLGLYFLLKRDARGVAGTIAALIVGLGVIPATVWGVPGMVELNRQMLTAVLQPGTTGSGDQTRAEELTNATSTDSQSFQAAIHNLLHPDPATRPRAAAPETRLAHWLVGGLLTLGLIFAARKMDDTPANGLLLLGSLCVLMLHLTPVSHMHYYAFSLPLACGVWLKGVAERPGRLVPARGTFAVLVVWGLASAAPLFPGSVFDVLRSSGLGLLASLTLLTFAAVQLRRKAKVPVVAVEMPLRRAA
ncbi:glycosyltransferase family 87 protein [Limnoglobus roseus]|uniref:DUF2029 domain-containing protein n=1 Tax=Limnoglobus roseus TaxID=2598579 RepID=A0A5C1A8R6_9BACT|nr:glycosyltransferase family 87 protein [Limnoglobus roseus]QEL14406.1 hypothetical protein PX52LOC_01294 [Limnoglobus roseus]